MGNVASPPPSQGLRRRHSPSGEVQFPRTTPGPGGHRERAGKADSKQHPKGGGGGGGEAEERGERERGAGGERRRGEERKLLPDRRHLQSSLIHAQWQQGDNLYASINARARLPGKGQSPEPPQIGTSPTGERAGTEIFQARDMRARVGTHRMGRNARSPATPRAGHSQYRPE